MKGALFLTTALVLRDLLFFAGDNAYAQVCKEALPALVAMVQRPDARATNESTIATDNAIAAVAKILKYNASMIDPNEVRLQL